MTRESFPGYTPPTGPLVHWVPGPHGYSLTIGITRLSCGAMFHGGAYVALPGREDAVTCEACRRAWREAQE